jgi:UDP-glucose 4-epimerase
MSRCLVIGGGLLGGAVAEALADRDHDVVVFSRSFGATIQELRTAGRPVRTVSGSIARSSQLAGLVEACDAVLYFAGGSTPAGAAADPGGSVELSVVPATTVLELMRMTSTRRIVLASSGGTVYGEPRVHPTPEGHAGDPISIHGQNALTSESYARFFGDHYGLEPVILRIATAYGPGQQTRRGQGVISAWIDAVQRGAPVQVYGSLATRRDFVFSEDVGDAVALAAFTAAPGAYNVGSGASHTLREVLVMVAQLAGGAFEIVHRPPRGVDVSHTQLDCSRLADEVGWAPATPLQDGLRRTWEWSAERQKPVAAAMPAVD